MTHEQLGEIVDAKKRAVTIYSMNLIEFDPPFFTLQAEVSKGTYVRALAHDVAQRIGSYATTYELARTKIGEITLDQAVQLADMTCFEDIKNHLIGFEELPILLGVSSYEE
jgi:tRNA pseudouridine55 synthase